MRTRAIYFFSFLFIVSLLLFSVYLQVYERVMPCPLCTLQRLTFGVLGFFFFLGIFFARHIILRNIINLLCLITSGVGICLAGRQIWLQHTPGASGTECGVSVQYMLQVLPLNEVMERILAGSAECTTRGWEFLNLNMAEWAILWFVLFFLLSLHLIFKKN